MDKMQSPETVRIEQADGIATIRLHRPEKLNAFTPQMMQELIAAFDRTDADDDIRVVIVTGAGRAFCAGADLSSGAGAFDHGAPDPTAIRRDTGGMLALRIYASHKPVIAAVNGPAVGVGATMQLPMDFRMASTEARFGFVFARRGITPEACSSWFLPRLVGPQQAFEWVYTGRVFGAEEALKGGLVRSLHPPEELLPAARALAREIADNTAPVSVALSRHLMLRMLGADHPMQAHKAESRAGQSRGRSGDARAGISAFLEKRPPVWADRLSAGLPDIFPDWPEPGFS